MKAIIGIPAEMSHNPGFQVVMPTLNPPSKSLTG